MLWGLLWSVACSPGNSSAYPPRSQVNAETMRGLDTITLKLSLRASKLVRWVCSMSCNMQEIPWLCSVLFTFLGHRSYVDSTIGLVDPTRVRCLEVKVQSHVSFSKSKHAKSWQTNLITKISGSIYLLPSSTWWCCLECQGSLFALCRSRAAGISLRLPLVHPLLSLWWLQRGTTFRIMSNWLIIIGSPWIR